MKKFAFALAPVAALALAACGSSDDASVDAEADTVEMPADEALTPITDEPVAAPVTTPTAEDTTAADNAAADADAAGEAAAAAAADVAAEASTASEETE
ncbi:hypothetical protein [Pelagerythrobacter sp.]|uniref:hypothetical protein n=1 Tax=Pelagerythrobacter sp. TaxID=2800702 RepID=UPI0035B244FE